VLTTVLHNSLLSLHYYQRNSSSMDLYHSLQKLSRHYTDVSVLKIASSHCQPHKLHWLAVNTLSQDTGIQDQQDNCPQDLPAQEQHYNFRHTEQFRL
jgi:hypothetical protein